MEFGKQINELRKREGLTQEQFAIKLNITRQAVSNWENDKNLPDIGMLILISNVFHISLDELIKGGNDMSNITEKIIKDGNEMRKAKINMISIMIGAFLLILGAMCFFIKTNSVEYIDANGFLHENFYLIPIGFLFMFCGLITFVVTGVRFTVAKIKESKLK